jgi:hypothetical protein
MWKQIMEALVDTIYLLTLQRPRPDERTCRDEKRERR